MLAAPAQPQPRAVRRREAGRLSCAPAVQPAWVTYRARRQAGPDAPPVVSNLDARNSGGAYRDVHDDGRPTEPPWRSHSPGGTTTQRAAHRPARLVPVSSALNV